ncbi:helix-turn-helix domain-containing protein [Lacinutrix salivirga]
MSDLNFNIYNIIIFTGIIQGLIFSLIVLFNKKYKSKTNNYIVFTVLALSFSNLQYWIDDVGLKGFISIFVNLRIPCDTLIVPFFFLFVNSYLKNKISNKNLFLLILPFFISLFFNIIISYKLFFNDNQLRTINILLETFSFLFNLILIVIIILKIKNYKKNNIEYIKENVRAKTKWLIHILYIGGIMCLFWFATIIIMQTSLNTGLKIYYPLWISISLLVYWISYVSIINSKINNDRETIRIALIEQNTFSKLLKPNNNISNNKSLNKIMDWITEEEIYLNPDLNLTLVADKFEISKGYISQLFNANTNYNFNDFINKLRINKSQEMLLDNNYKNYTIESIGLEAGFNSKSSFYTAFKKFTNKTPVQYKKGVRNN